MTETAAHMSHTLTTHETHYELHAALELTSRACKLFHQHLCSDNPDLNTATGLLCSSDDDKEDADQNVSSLKSAVVHEQADKRKTNEQYCRHLYGLGDGNHS